jgi:hypothetical protein
MSPIEPTRADSLGRARFSIMNPSLATRLGSVLRLGLFLCVLFGVVLVNVIWNSSVWRHATPDAPAATKQPDSFDLRFPVEIEPGHQGPRPDGALIDTQWMPPPPKLPFPRASAPQAQGQGVDPIKLRRVMDLGVAQYASAADDQGKSKGVSLIQLAALLGYAPARELVVRNYLRSPAVRSIVPPLDAVRFAIDLVGPGAPASNEDVELVIALGNYFSQRGDVLKFARHIVDAISGDQRLQASDGLARLLSIFARVPGLCTGIKRAISADLRINQNCSSPLNEELLDYAHFKGELKTSAEARLRAMRLLDKLEGASK